MATRVTVVNGSSPTGVYAADGSINVVVLSNPTSPVGVYHPCGAFNVVMASDFLGGLYHPSGAYKAVDLGGGVYAFGPFSATGSFSITPPFPAPAGFSWQPVIVVIDGVSQQETVTIDSINHPTFILVKD